MGSVVRGAVVKDVAEAVVAFDSKDVVEFDANEEADEDIEAEVDSVEPIEELDDDEEPIKLFGDFGELLRQKNFVITLGFDFGCCCCGCCCCCCGNCDVAIGLFVVLAKYEFEAKECKPELELCVEEE